MGVSYSIQSAEYKKLKYNSALREDCEHDPHSYLLLLKINSSGDFECIDQLHFKPKEISSEEKVFLGHCSNKWKTKSEHRTTVDRIRHFKTESEQEALAMWNRALAIAEDINEKNLPFVFYTGANCQSGVRTVLDTLGLEFDPEGQIPHTIRGGNITMFNDVSGHLKTPVQTDLSVEALKEANARLRNDLREHVLV